MIRDLTTGSVKKVLWSFSVPLLLSMVFQQIYNIADSVIAGRFAGKDALAAVGASYPITMIFIAIATGCNIGCSVVISQIFGSKNYTKMKTAISTSLISVAALAGVLTILGLLSCNASLALLNTPENIFVDSGLYLRIYIFGLAFLFIYNVCTGIFAALGDSKTPLYFLIASSIGNIILDIILVKYFAMGVAGVAIATFLAQGVAAILAFIVLIKRLRKIETEEKHEIFSIHMLSRISTIAIPSILQQSFISIGNLFIQNLVNGFGSDVIAGYSAAIRINTFVISSIVTLGNGVSSFTAQNIGAKKTERVSKGFKAGALLMAIFAIPSTIICFAFSKYMIGIFVDMSETAVISAGVEFLKIVTPFYIVIALKLLADSVLRGAGAMGPFMVATFTDLILRVVLAFVLVGAFETKGIWMSWPIGWITATIMSYGFYKKGIWKKSKNI